VQWSSPEGQTSPRPAFLLEQQRLQKGHRVEASKLLNIGKGRGSLAVAGSTPSSVARRSSSASLR